MTIGNRKLHHTLYLAGMLQLRWNPKAKAYYDKKIREGKTKKHALKCVMKRTACIIYGMLKNGKDYQERRKGDSLEEITS
jgi:transposase